MFGAYTSTSSLLRAAEWAKNIGLRVVVIGGVILASAVLAYAGSPNQMRLVLAAALVVGISALFLRYPGAGPMALVATGLLIPFGIGTGTQSTINAPMLLLVLLLGLWVFDMVVHRRQIRLLPSPTIVPAIVFMIVAVLAALAGQLSWFFASPAPLRSQLGGLAILVLSPAAFLLVAHQITSVAWLRRMVWMFLALGSLHLVGRMVPGAGFIFNLFPTGSVGSLFWVWLLVLASGQALLNKQLTLPKRLLLWLLVITVVYTTLIQARTWVSGYLPALIGVLTMLMLTKPRIGVVLALTLGAFLLFSDVNPVAGIVQFSNDQFSFMTRIEAWRIMAEIIRVSPVFGLGPANYYWYTPLYQIFGYHVRFNSHNQYIDLVAQIGLLGLVCFGWFMWRVARVNWRMLHTVEPGGFEYAFVVSAFGGLIGSLAAGMLGDWLLPFVYNIGMAGFRSSLFMWLFLGGMVALQAIYSQEKSASTAAR